MKLITFILSCIIPYVISEEKIHDIVKPDGPQIAHQQPLEDKWNLQIDDFVKQIPGLKSIHTFLML